MKSYYLNKNTGEVHESGCSWLKKVNFENKHYLGVYGSAKVAVSAAKKIQSNADGCAYCCVSAHTC